VTALPAQAAVLHATSAYGLANCGVSSLAFYNTCEEVGVLVTSLRRLAAARR